MSTGITVVPNPVIPNSHHVAIATISLFFLFGAWIAVSARFYTRAFIVKALGWDDWAMLATLILFSAYAICVVNLVYLIRANEPLMPANIMTITTNLLIACESLYIMTMVVLKISLGIFFLRILVEQWQRTLIYAVVSLSSFVGFGYFWYAVFYCGVPNAGGLMFWEKRLMGKCEAAWPSLVLGLSYTHAVVTALTDIVLVTLTIPVIKRAQNLLLREKLIMAGVFVLATVGCVASIVRFVYIPALDTLDLSFWNGIEDLAIWSTIEPGLGIIALSCATLRPLIASVSHCVSARNLAISEITEILPSPPITGSFTDSFTLSRKHDGRKRSLEALRSGLSRTGRGGLKKGAPTRTNPRPAFFQGDAVRSQDTIDMQIERSRARDFPRTTPFTPHLLDPEPEQNNDFDDVEGGDWGGQRFDRRATWWPLPRQSVMRDTTDIMFKK